MTYHITHVTDGGWRYLTTQNAGTKRLENSTWPEWNRARFYGTLRLIPFMHPTTAIIRWILGNACISIHPERGDRTVLTGGGRPERHHTTIVFEHTLKSEV